LKNSVVIALVLAVIASIFFWPDAAESPPANPKTTDTLDQQKQVSPPALVPERFRSAPPEEPYYQGHLRGDGFRPLGETPMRYQEQQPYRYGARSRSTPYDNQGQQYQDSDQRYGTPAPLFDGQPPGYATQGSRYGSSATPYGDTFGYSRAPSYKFRPREGEIKEKEKERRPGRYQNYPQPLPEFEDPALTPNTPTYGNPPAPQWDMPNYPGSNLEFPQTSNQHLFSGR
jgi:hypothetical protein